MKKLIAALLAAMLVLALAACNKVTLHCDGCGKEVSADSNMDESWSIFCNDCAKDLDIE